MTDRRYSLEPLTTAAGDVSTAEFKALLRINGATLNQWRDEGLSFDAAVRSADRLRVHRYELWPEMADDDETELTRPCDECGERFWPKRHDQKFCTPRCNRRWWARESKRRRYQRDPVFAERMRRQRRAYYAECRTYELARQREYDRKRRGQRPDERESA